MTNTTSDHSSAPQSSGALLVDRDFGPWFWGNLASNSGNWLFNVTAAVVVFDLTRSALLVGLVSVAQFAPLVVISPWAGALSDRVDRRRLILAGQALAAMVATALAVPAVSTIPGPNAASTPRPKAGAQCVDAQAGICAGGRPQGRSLPRFMRVSRW